MPQENHAREAQLKDIRRKMYQVEGGERLQLWMDYTLLQDQDEDKPDWLSGCMPYMKLHSWSTDDPKHPRVVFSYEVPSHNSNRMGNMHGGCTASLFDFATSLPVCLINKPGFWFYLGVSRTLNVTYLRPIPVGEKIFIECEIMSIGKTLCTIRGIMRRQSDGVALATCEHGKFNTDPEPEKDNSKSKL